MATTLEKIKQIEREQYNDFDGRKMGTQEQQKY